MASTVTTTTESAPLLEPGSKLSRSTKYSYALGHVFNDLVAAMWFSYTLLFLQRVALLQPIAAGGLVLLGQLTDAIVTPLLGVMVDKYSKKKTWHVFGSILVAISFPLIFGSYIGPRTPQMIMYIFSTMLFHVGWAAVQISHLSMIPALASSPLVRSELTAIRYSAQVSAAIVVFVVTWVILPNRADVTARVGPGDDYKFRRISIVLTAIGVVSSILFHEFLNARLLESRSSISSVPTVEVAAGHEIQVETAKITGRRRNSLVTRTQQIIRPALKTMLMVAFLYASARLFTALSTVYLPLYITEANVGGKQALATVPLVSYLSSFTMSILLKHISRPYGSKTCFYLGTFVGLIAAAVTEFAGSNIYVIYLTAVLIGTGSSITTVAALSITADIIGPRTESSAYVYSVVTFVDKVFLGMIVFLIEKWRCKNRLFCPHYNRDALASVCAFSMGVGLLTLLIVSRYLPNNN